MAYLRATPHYKGAFPLDIGGVTLGGYGQKEITPDSFADMVAAANFPFVVKCDRNGKYLVDVPPVEPVQKAPEVLPEPKTEVEPSKSETEAGEVAPDSDALSASIEIEKPARSKKGK
jgi:hypothetical protein